MGIKGQLCMNDTILLGGAAGKQILLDAGMANRHGLITGATGTGKTDHACRCLRNPSPGWAFRFLQPISKVIYPAWPRPGG